MARVGLVLGGGGVVGIAWETGVLWGLAEVIGFEPSDAVAIVGTSAGSVVGAQLLLGRTLDELAGAQRAQDALTASASADRPRDAQKSMEIFQTWGGAERMTRDIAARVGALAVDATSAPESGWVGGFERQLATDDWPPGDLRVTAVRCDNGERVVWTRDSGVRLPLAVASSCAVPGLFPPVTIGDARYMDGGVWSGSNADVLLGSDIDAGLFIGPLIGETGLGRVSGVALASERDALAAEGVTLHEIVPGDAFRAAGMNLMDPAKREAALEIGILEGRAAAERLRASLR